MAKVKSSGLRNYIGKLGGNVYYMRAGQNIARELAAQVSNPRTAAQMGQRTALANLVRFYQVSKSWMEARAFEFRKANQSVYNALVSANISSTPVYLDKGDVDNGIVVAAPYRVADGSLPTIGAFYEAADDEFNLRINVGEISITNDLTIAALSAAIIGGNTAQEWQEGDQLSLIIYEQGDLLGTGQWKLAVASFEFIIDTEDGRLFKDVYTDFAGILDTNTDGDLVTDDIGPLFEGFDETYGFACVAVHSRTYKGATTVSRETLALDGDASSWLEHYTGEVAKRRAGRSYGERAEYFLDAQRVQHSGQSEKIQITNVLIGGDEFNALTNIPEDTTIYVVFDQTYASNPNTTVEAVDNQSNATVIATAASIYDSRNMWSFATTTALENIVKIRVKGTADDATAVVAEFEAEV